ncbi:hypothetical protein ACIGO9_27395 [Nocardia asteroides]|uniref:hypothetical protein n=1 Tax=Nocardia asteroides TaxID=1824 RepID=UPI0037CA75BD
MPLGVNPSEWKQLLAQADAGELALDPEVGRDLDRVCDDHLDRLEEVLGKIGTVSFVSGFGTFNSGVTLEKKFSLTASGGERALDSVIQQHIEAVQTAKEVVAKAIANFVAQDENSGAQITAAGGPS